MLRIDGRLVVLDQSRVQHVALAVELVDNYTHKRPLGALRVSLKELERESIVNVSGFHLFLDIPPDIYTLRVESQHYFVEEILIHIPGSPPNSPWERLILHPRPSYPFLPRTTLIRGVVKDNMDTPIPDTQVDIIGKSVSNRSDENGEFVLYFRGLTEQDIITINRMPYVKGNGDQMLPVRASHPLYGSVTTSLELPEGTTAFVHLVLP